MNEVWYDSDEDVLDLELDNGVYWKTIELGNGVNVDISKEGKILSIEVLNAKKAFSGDARKVIEKAKLVVEN